MSGARLSLQELFVPLAPHINLAMMGVEVFSNGSGSHHQLRKLNTRRERGHTDITRRCSRRHLLRHLLRHALPM